MMIWIALWDAENLIKSCQSTLGESNLFFPIFIPIKFFFFMAQISGSRLKDLVWTTTL